MRTRPAASILPCLGAALLAGSLDPTHAAGIVIRHDVDPVASLELGAQFRSVLRIGFGAGTLIDARWALTARHVVKSMTPLHHSVAAGDDHYRIEAIYTHPDHPADGRLHRPHDLALVRLASPVGDAKPTPLCRGDDAISTMITLVGPGGAGDGRAGPTIWDGRMRGATNRIVGAGKQWLTFTFAHPPGGTRLEGVSGPGDSGGPAFIEVDGETFLAGVSCWADSEDSEDSEDGVGTYGVIEGYARVSQYVDWIEDVMSGRTAPPPLDRGDWRAVDLGERGSGDEPAAQRAREFFDAFNEGSLAEFRADAAEESDDLGLLDDIVSARTQLRERWGALHPTEAVIDASGTEIWVRFQIPGGERMLWLKTTPGTPHLIAAFDIQG